MTPELRDAFDRHAKACTEFRVFMRRLSTAPEKIKASQTSKPDDLAAIERWVDAALTTWRESDERYMQILREFCPDLLEGKRR